jgi:hypothetical protein
VQQYSLPQLESFLAAVADQEKAEQRMAMITARAAKAPAKKFKEILREFG